MIYNAICTCGEHLKNITFSIKNKNLKHIILCRKCLKNHIIELITNKYQYKLSHRQIQPIITYNNDEYQYNTIISCNQCSRDLVSLTTKNTKRNIMQDVICYGCDEYITYNLVDNYLIICGKIRELNTIQTINIIDNITF